jgi:hypothetical protein
MPSCDVTRHLAAPPRLRVIRRKAVGVAKKTRMTPGRLWQAINSDFELLRRDRCESGCRVPLPEPADPSTAGPNWKLELLPSCKRRCDRILEALYRHYSETVDVAWDA